MSLPSSGDVIGGKYRVGNPIAEGGMGVVVEGLHVQLEESVAIKFLKPDVVGTAGEEVVKRFMREARTCIKIRSEHVVRVLDVDTLPTGVPYIVMERLSGRDLDAIVETSGPLPVASTIDYVLQALEALAEAHALGIIHRDLKPANLFLSERADGSPCIKVLDFGISKIESGTDGGMTHTQAVMGSPRYMSPEQLRASRDVDARTDIWAIGIVLYELLTGRAPFDGGSMTQIAAAILENVPAPLALSSPHAAAIEAVVMQCLAKKAVERFANVAELAAALAPYGSASANISASRIHGVLHRNGPPSSQALPPPSQPSIPAIPSASQASGGRTDVSWADAKSPSAGNRRLGVFAGGAALLAVIGIVLALAAFKRKDETKAAALQPSSAVSVIPQPAPVESVAVAPKDATPVASASAVATAEPSATIARPPANVGHRPAPAPPKTAPKAHTATSPASTAPSAPTPTPASTTWSDRK